jgi:hypothetical protein
MRAYERRLPASRCSSLLFDFRRRLGLDRRAGFQGKAPDAAFRLAQRAATNARALREDDDTIAALKDRARGVHRSRVAGAAVDREGAQRVEDPCLPALLEQLPVAAERHGGHRAKFEQALKRTAARDDERVCA